MSFNYLPLLLIFNNSKVGSTIKVYSVGQKILLHESQLLLVFVTLVEPAGVSVMTSSSSHAKKSHVVWKQAQLDVNGNGKKYLRLEKQTWKSRFEEKVWHYLHSCLIKRWDS